MDPASLPIAAIRDRLPPALQKGPVVITAPTGTGKSTEVPRWLSGRVLVIQPRRVACQAVASRIAHLERAELGTAIGYRVRDDDCSTKETRVLVMTPGIVLNRPALLDEFDTVVVDELHERRLDTDLIVALLQRKKKHFVTMSATLEAERVSQALGATLLSVEARSHPVDIEYHGPAAELPSARDLDRRVVDALRSLEPLGGDVLVFLPGKAEIRAAAAAVEALPHPVLTLHGGLRLKEQAKVLTPSKRPRVILTTNVAETSLTVPGVRAVIDSGLVRRTVYHGGRSYLALSPVALDSADQRAGRAGRTAPGRCLRLWGQLAKLETTTPPEIHRESLVPLVLSTASLQVRPETLPFLDPPKDFALEDARDRLRELGAIEAGDDDTDRLTERGQRLSGIPLDPWLSRVLVEAERRGCLEDAIDLVAILEQPSAAQLAGWPEDEQLELPECDLSALMVAMREESAPRGPLKSALEEAHRTRRRLRKLFGVGAPSASAPSLDREKLLATILRADPRTAHIVRERKNRVYFTSGGTELELGNKSRANRLLDVRGASSAKRLEALVVLSTMALSEKARDKRLLITLASPIPLRLLYDLGFGQERVGRTTLDRKGKDGPRLLVESERVYAGKVLGKSEQEPEGQLARTALARLFVEGRWLKRARKEAEARLARRGLLAELSKRRSSASPDPFPDDFEAPPGLEEFALGRLQELGVERGSDVALLEPDDLLPDDVPAELAPALNERFPRHVDLGDCLYDVRYDLDKRQALLSVVKGGRKTPPPASYLPRFEGFRVFVEAGGSFHPVKR